VNFGHSVMIPNKCVQHTLSWTIRFGTL
jgi:hypothetical protein